MNGLKKRLWDNHFSHIYVEKDILEDPQTENILKRFDKDKIVLIDNYKQIFNRRNQNFSSQKMSRNLILATKKDELIYKGSNLCEDFDNDNFYYCSSIMNCLYDCEYCYLQGMYQSANIVIFLNIDDIFKELDRLLMYKKIYLCISYDSDLLALNSLTGFVDRWIEYANKNKNLTIELRTKSSNYKSIKIKSIKNNIIFAYTLSPQNFIKDYEKYSASLKNRMKDMKNVILDGHKLRVCIDPIIDYTNSIDDYKSLIDYIFSEISEKDVLDYSIGVFRIAKDYLKLMRKGNEKSKILSYPFQIKDGVASYGEKRENYLVGEIKDYLLKYTDESKIYC